MVDPVSLRANPLLPAGIAGLALLLAVICLFIAWGSIDLEVGFGDESTAGSEPANLFTYDGEGWSSRTDIDDSANLLFVAGIVTAVGVLELAAAVAFASVPAMTAMVPGIVRAFLFLGAAVLLAAGLVIHIIGAIQFAGSEAFNGSFGGPGGVSSSGSWTPGAGGVIMALVVLATIGAAVMAFKQAGAPSAGATAPMAG